MLQGCHLGGLEAPGPIPQGCQGQELVLQGFKVDLHR